MRVFTTGVLLAAGSSRRLGRPKQLLPLHGTATLLDASLDTARACRFDQLLVMVGAFATEIRERTGFTGTETVIDVPEHTAGCGSSVRTAVAHVDPRADGVVLLLGDQPGVRPEDVHALVRASRASPAGLCRYREDALGHPLWFHRELFGRLRALHGDKAVWKLLHSGGVPVVEHPVDRNVPRDVDTWDDYEALLAEAAAHEDRPARRGAVAAW